MAELQKVVSFEPELIKGSGGVYKIWVDGELIWDKRAQGGFPEESAIVGRVKTMVG